MSTDPSPALVDDGPLHPDLPAAIAALARGENPLYERAFPHPRHGELTFRARLPTTLQSMRHSVAMDNYLAGLGVADLDSGAMVQPRTQTSILAAALAGMVDGLMLELPEIGRTEEDDDERGSVRVTIHRYDPLAELDMTFVCGVWMDFSLWRGGLLTPGAVKDLGKD